MGHGETLRMERELHTANTKKLFVKEHSNRIVFILKVAVASIKYSFTRLICSHTAAICKICELVHPEYKSNYFGLVNLPNLSSFPWSPFLATCPLSLLAVLRSEWQRVISSSSEDKTH